MRIFNDVAIPEKWQGLAAERAFAFLGSADEPIAVRAFSMTVLFNIGKEQPDLLPELRLMIEDLLPYGSPGIKSRGRRTIQAIDKLLKDR